MNAPTAPEADFTWLRDQADAFMRSPANDLDMATPEPAFDMPLYGVAAGDDPLWEAYKGDPIGPFHWTPAEAFALGYPEEHAAPSELFVLSWVLPQTEATRRDNRKETFYPCERWARSRVLSEPRVNRGLRQHMVAVCREAGIQAVSPMLLPEWSRCESPKYGYASTWSERHAAHAAGLGTFGLSDGLITARGKAMRVGSVIVRRALPVTPRPYTDHHAYCLFYTKGTCGKCADRCPVGSVTREGRFKSLCKQHTRKVCSPYLMETWGLDGYGCGLCQTGVPCEARIPQPRFAAGAAAKGQQPR